MNVTQDWQATLTNGLINNRGRPAPVYSGSYTVPMHDMQLSEIVLPGLEVLSDNSRNAKIQSKFQSKNKTYATRTIGFLPQE
jgi:hypothetical protein